jgi:hypothetical protein
MNPDTTPTPIYDSIIATKSKVAHAAFIKTFELLLNKERAARQKAERELTEKTNDVARLRELLESAIEELSGQAYTEISEAYAALAPAPEEPSIEREEPLYIIGNSWSR